MFSTLDTYDTEYSADSVEWCPAKGFRDLFVCGTYQLVTGEKDEALGKSENSEKRVGKIDLFRIIKNGKLRLLQTFGNTAVLDMKWTDADIRNKHFLGVVTSRGYLQIYSLEETEPAMKLVAETRIRRDEKEVSALSLDWNTGRWKSDSGSEVRITVSDSEGFVSLYKFNGEKLTLLTEKKLHRFEAWISAFDYWTPDIIYSGGDDCKFHRLDARMGLEPIGGNRVHGAGVTSLRSNAGNEYSLASGSYDEVLRLWDTRNIERPISETRLGGGIWRLKWEPFKHEKLLAACMYSGFRLIDCKDQSNPQIIDEYNEHESIAYGCDWSLLPNTIIQSDILDECSKTLCLVATCSFYDHTLKFSSLDLPID